MYKHNKGKEKLLSAVLCSLTGIFIFIVCFLRLFCKEVKWFLRDSCHFLLLKETLHSPPSCLPPQAQHTHDAITEAAQLMKEAVDDIMVTLNEAASEVGLVGGMVDAIAEAMSKVGLGSQTAPSLLDPTSSCVSLRRGPRVLFLTELSFQADSSKPPLSLRVLITIQMSSHSSNTVCIPHCH